MKKRIVLVLLVAAAWFFFIRDTPARWKGIPAPRQPVQSSAGLPAAFRNGEYTIKPLAKYQITAVVLRGERYRFAPLSDLCPLDLALGWGPMSTAYAINGLKITQHGRFYFYSWKNEAPLEPEQIAQNSANTHCLPADAKIRSQLLAVKRHELVTLEGYLVEASTPDGGTWRSSLTRDDTEGGACEILWVTSVSRKKL
ncbi:hypothetical protein CMV30_11510 [Nibricoccus aquaticus]|uniref:Uncharacterized protein n=1 Tax=Nibricoccus aquaticus TaxID=2576891 RepID=A0A290Q7A2_9BACT|nr:hypothetical protein [Nibricoccus aquaticus]ATC64529.1 hypothetical protein CMV30_11510 [Nibricoccus aquaticus]